MATGNEVYDTRAKLDLSCSPSVTSSDEGWVICVTLAPLPEASIWEHSLVMCQKEHTVAPRQLSACSNFWDSF